METIDSLGDALLAWFVDVNLYTFQHSFPRPTKDWPFAKFSVALGTTVGYLFFVLLGRVFMSFSSPMDHFTYPIRFVYNIMQIMLCSYMTIEASALAYRNAYNVYPCNAFDTQNPPIGPLLWLFYVSKMLDFVDTVVIILGKKWGQLSFLHVYHHATIFMVYWVNLNVG